MTESTIAEIAEKVSLLMQIDRMKDGVSSKVDMKALSNLPIYIASVFEKANQVDGDMTPAQAYAIVNKRISEVQSQVYLMRLELENRSPRDPASIYNDPLVISAYGERVEVMTTVTRTFTFGPEILADGWYPMEMNELGFHRWMRPGARSLACVPHLGTVDQKLAIRGRVLHPDQLDGLEIRSSSCTAHIETLQEGGGNRFLASFELKAEDVEMSNYLPVTFHMKEFRSPKTADTRSLGADIREFTCSPLGSSHPAAPPTG